MSRLEDSYSQCNRHSVGVPTVLHDFKTSHVFRFIPKPMLFLPAFHTPTDTWGRLYEKWKREEQAEAGERIALHTATKGRLQHSRSTCHGTTLSTLTKHTTHPLGNTAIRFDVGVHTQVDEITINTLPVGSEEEGRGGWGREDGAGRMGQGGWGREDGAGGMGQGGGRG